MLKVSILTRLGMAPRLLAVACAAAMGAAPVMAQDSQANQADAKRLDTVTVTGSRISNPNAISPTPINVMTADDIKATGAVNIGDVMTQLTQVGTSFTMGNSTRFIGTAGVQPIDLRSLGTSRTLVLVNGRRFVGSAAGSTDVDVNLIPADFIERVEVITGGASAVYGADAVSGVVNFILKKKYTGAALHVQYGDSEHGGFNKGLVSLTGGMNFAQDRGNVAVSVEHSTQGSLEFPDRFGHQAYRALQTPGGPTGTALFSNAGGYKTINAGTFALGGQRYVFNPDHSARPQNLGTFHDSSGCQDCDRIDTNQVLQLQPRYGRTSVTAIGSFDITPEHRLYAEGSYSHVNVKTFSQPAFGSYVINRDNAYINPALGALMDANNAQTITVGRFDVDAGRRGEDTRRDIARVVFGGNGVIAGDWEYDASVVYGTMDETRHNLNNRLVDRFADSIDAVRDPSGNIVCRSGAAGCIPTSIFGDGAIDPRAAQWFNTTTTTTSRVTQFVGGGSITNNNLFQMPGNAGSASMVAGVEFRRESSKQINDPLDRNGETFLNAIPNSSGAYNVKEGYLEFVAPLLADHTLVKNLTFDSAARFSDYDSIGHTKTWRWGLDWAIDDNVRLRGTMSSAVRAPNIGELYSGQSVNFANFKDPCSVTEIGNGSKSRAANCQALGVPVGFDSAQASSYKGLSGSNPNLKPELGRTWTAGFVFTPTFIDGFGMNVDYWNIKLTNAITQLDFETVAKHCVDSSTGIDNIYCANITRGADHEISNIVAVNENISQLNTSGIDFGAYYTHAVGAGKLQLNLDVTKVIAYTEYPFQDDPTTTQQDNGTATTAGAWPKWKASLRATYAINNWVFNWNTRFFSRMLRVTNESYKANPTSTTPIYSASGFYNDVRASYDFKNTGLQVYAGITNVFDRNPPVNVFGTTGASGNYDVIGRSYFAGLNYQF